MKLFCVTMAVMSVFAHSALSCSRKFFARGPCPPFTVGASTAEHPLENRSFQRPLSLTAILETKTRRLDISGVVLIGWTTLHRGWLTNQKHGLSTRPSCRVSFQHRLLC